MKVLPPDNYLSGDIIMRYAFPHLHDEILEALDSVKVNSCLNPSTPFSKDSTKKVPKRQAWSKDKSKQALRPISQTLMNQEIERALRSRGWKSQPVADPSKTKDLPRFRGDFFKEGVFVEVEFGNSASFYRDLFKFQVAHRAEVGTVGVVIAATTRTTSLQDSGQTDFSLMQRSKPYIHLGTSMPLWLIGIEPEDFAPVEARYNEMYAVLQNNNVAAATWAEYQAPYLVV